MRNQGWLFLNFHLLNFLGNQAQLSKNFLQGLFCGIVKPLENVADPFQSTYLVSVKFLVGFIFLSPHLIYSHCNFFIQKSTAVRFISAAVLPFSFFVNTVLPIFNLYDLFGFLYSP